MPRRATVRAARAGRVLSAAGLVVLLAACGGAAAAPVANTATTNTATTSTPVAAAPAPSSEEAGTASASTTESSSTPDAAPGTALVLLAGLEVKGRAPKTGYDRDLFGQTWADTDRNGCDTRNDVLRRDLVDTALDPATRGCVVLSGTLADPFSGTTIPFERGQVTSSDVQIDHVVALSDAWQKGAQQWTAEQRLAFGNDPLNLLAVDGALNGQKGDGDAATWLPPNRPYRCAYVARQVSVKAKYGAWVTEAERAAIEHVLTDCPDEQVPTSEAPVPAPPAPPPPPAAAPSSCDPAYPGVCIPPFSEVGDLDCGDVEPRRFAVVAPDPHGFDREGDGVGCES